MNMIDIYTLEGLHALRDPITTHFFLFVTELGDTLIIGSIALIFGLYLIIRERLSFFAGLVTSLVGTGLIVFTLKDLIARARPDAAYQAYLETGFSLPSGHASLSLALYGFLAYFLWKEYPARRRLFVALLGTLVVLISFSRLYLGVHFLSDVLVAHLIAGLFLALGIFVAERLSRHSILF